MYKNIFSVCLIGFFLLGCTAIKQNVVLNEPTEGERARVRIVIPDTDYRGVRAYPNSACMSDKVQGNGMVTSVQMILGFEKNLNNKKIGMPTTSYSVDQQYMNAEIYVAANQPITFRFLKPQTIIKNGVYVTVLNDGCFVAKSFIPDSNNDYEIVFNDGKQCLVAAEKIVRKNESVSMTAVATETASDCKK